MAQKRELKIGEEFTLSQKLVSCQSQKFQTKSVHTFEWNSNRSSHITMSYHPEWYWIECKNMTSLRTWDTWALHLGLDEKLRSMIEAWKKHGIWEELGTNHANPGLSDAVERANLEIAADMGGFDDSYLLAQRMRSLGCSCSLSFP